MTSAQSEVDLFAAKLSRLRRERELGKSEAKARGGKRKVLSERDREIILSKTAKRCHICGGEIDNEAWQADHVFAHSAGGTHSTDNYLPAHAVCNNYRWDYTSEEFQWILKLGVWMRTQIETGKACVRPAAEQFLKAEATRMKRRSGGLRER